MKKLKTLIRLNRWKVDEESRALTALLREAAALTDAEAALSRQMEEEREAAASSIEAAALFGVYVQGLIARRRKLEVERARLEVRIAMARDRLRAAMGETKKFEIVDEKAEAEERRAALARETETLNEAALNGFRRREEE